MRKKKLAALFAIPVSTLLVIAGTQSTIIASAVGIEGDASTPITTAASAETIEMCGWRISGVEPTISLANQDPLLEYVGSEYELAGADEDILIYLSGDAVEDTRCSFYGEYAGAQVKVSWSGSSFVSSPDTSMGWNLSDKNLRITYADTGCDADWETEDLVSIAGAFVTGQDVIPAKIPATAVGAADYSPDSVDSSTFPSCGFSAAYTTAIPGGKVPTAPGTPYTFAGPSLTSTLVLEP
jgi:glutaredoxin-related protein